MATATNPDEPSDREVEKDVTITAYFDESYNEKAERDAADILDLQDRDFREMKETTTERRFLVLGDGDDAARIEIDQNTELSVLRNIVDNDIDGPVTVETETETDSSFRYSPKYRVPEGYTDILLGSLPEMATVEGTALTRRVGSWNDDTWADEDDETVFNLSEGYFQRRQRLKHRSERTKDDRYEDDTMFWSVDFTISIGPTSEALVSTLSERWVGSLMDTLVSQPSIQQVRMTDCKVTREGDCYDV